MVPKGCIKKFIHDGVNNYDPLTWYDPLWKCVMTFNSGSYENLIVLKFDMRMIFLKFADYKRGSTWDVNNSRTNTLVKQTSTQLNTRFFMGKPFKDKNPKALIIHPLNDMTEFVHEQRNLVHRTLRWMYQKFSKTKKSLAGLLLLFFCCCHVDYLIAATSTEACSHLLDAAAVV